ncbi:MAG: DinB family protein [Acidobacteriota bacterium]|nr:DinB family protein [Acidobacteriota bacterium]
MLKRIVFIAAFSVFVSLNASALIAQEGPSKGAAAVDGFRGLAIAQLKDVADKYIGLAKETPEDKLAWRPAEKIRSNTEVWMHVANANFLISKSLGADIPADLPKEMEKVTDRKMVLHYLKLSFKTASDQIAKLKEEDMNKEVDFFGSPLAIQAVILQMTVHCHNHLGQSIAYARMNGVKPPWAES